MKRCLALCLFLTLTACGSSPKTQFYTLVPVPPSVPVTTSPRHAVFGVGHVELPGVLDRTALVTQGAGAQIVVSDTDRWAAPLDELVRRALTDDLRSRLGVAAVVAPGDEAPHGVRNIAVMVQRFIADPAGHVVLEADWTVATGNPPRPGPAHHAQLQQEAGGKDGDAIAAAMSRALGLLADQIARQIAE